MFRYTRVRMLTGLSPHGSGNSPSQKPPDPRRSPEQPNYEALEAPGGPLESCSLFTESVPSPTWGPMYLPSPRVKGAFQADGLRALPLSAAGSGPHGDLPSLAHSLQSLDLPGLGDGQREAWPCPSQHVNILYGGERVRE